MVLIVIAGMHRQHPINSIRRSQEKHRSQAQLKKSKHLEKVVCIVSLCVIVGAVFSFAVWAVGAK